MSDSIERKVDKELLKKDLHEYIPTACHVDQTTLINRNGELIQIIRIDGIDSEVINHDLINLRSYIRDAINSSVNENISIWITTIRQKKNIDDTTPYPNFISANIHRLWRKKNYWDDKYVNSLYISFVYKGAQMNTWNWDGFIQSLFVSNIYKFHDNFITNAVKVLTAYTNNIMELLKQFNPTILKIEEFNETFISNQMSLYGYLLTAKEKQYEVDMYDLSKNISKYDIAIGNDKIEILSDDNKKFASIISIKGCQDVPNDDLHLLMQLPINMVITEIFYSITQKEIQSKFIVEEELLKMSRSDDLYNIKGFNQIFSQSDKKESFCNQQINIMCINDKVEFLNQHVKIISDALCELGLPHVKEDIGLEQAYWSQVPGNFKFLKRLYPNLYSNIGAFASLHNLPVGKKHSQWGRNVTIFRTAIGTPYFFNFHNENGNGHTLIIGQKKSGKTTLANFLVSEATKYDPSILYLSDNECGRVFIEAINGSLVSAYDTNIGSMKPKELKEFIIVSLFGPSPNDYKSFDKVLDEFVKYILGSEKIDIQDFCTNYNFANTEEKKIKKSLEFFSCDEYKGFFSKAKAELSHSSITEVSLQEYSDVVFKQKYWPEDTKLINDYNANLAINRNFRDMIIYHSIEKFCKIKSDKPKIIVIDNLLSMLSAEFLQSKYIDKIFECMSSSNTILVCNVDIQDLVNNAKILELEKLLQLFGTKLIMPCEALEPKFQTALSFSDDLYHKIKSLPILSRIFFIMQDDQTVELEISLGSLTGILKILSSKPEEVKLFKEVRAKFTNNDNEWIKELYNKYNID